MDDIVSYRVVYSIVKQYRNDLQVQLLRLDNAAVPVKRASHKGDHPSFKAPISEITQTARPYQVRNSPVSKSVIEIGLHRPRLAAAPRVKAPALDSSAACNSTKACKANHLENAPASCVQVFTQPYTLRLTASIGLDLEACFQHWGCCFLPGLARFLFS